MRYFIELAYKGTNFHGWQIQNNANTVQETLEKAISLILNEQISVTGAGRTDTGVHAEFFIAHIDTEKNISDTQKLVFRLNSLLGKDIAVYRIYEVPLDKHARFSAVLRTYQYRIHTTKDPFSQDTSLYVYQKLDFDKMNTAAQKLFEYTDFTSFSKLHTDTKTNNCKIYEAKWFVNQNRAYFEISADRFLRNMVRAIVGTLIEVGLGKLTVDQFCKVIESRNRANAGYSVPPQGLFLTKIEY